jgi:hypothetical protein
MVSFGLDGVDLDFEVDMREKGAPELLTALVSSIWNCMNDEETKTKCVAPVEYDLICKRNADLCDDSRFSTSQISMSVWMDGACEDVDTENDCLLEHSFKKVFAEDVVKKNVQFVNVMSYDFELKEQRVILPKKDVVYNYTDITSASAKQWKKLLGDNGPDLVMGLSTERQAVGAAGSVVDDNGDFTNEYLNALMDVINESADGLFVWSNKLNDDKNPALKNTPLGLLCKTTSLACDSINYTCNPRPQKAKARPPPPRLAPDPLWSTCVHGAWNEMTSSACRSMCNNFASWSNFDRQGDLPDKGLPDEELRRFHSLGKEIYLTFDDGPGPGNGINDGTTQMLDVLSEEGVKASFWLVGDNVDAGKQGTSSALMTIADLHKEVKDDHMVGSHSRTHFPPGCTYTNVCGALNDFSLGTSILVHELECVDKQRSLCASSKDHKLQKPIKCKDRNKQVANLQKFVRQPCTNTWRSPEFNFTDAISSEGGGSGIVFQNRNLSSVLIARRTADLLYNYSCGSKCEASYLTTEGGNTSSADSGALTLNSCVTPCNKHASF